MPVYSADLFFLMTFGRRFNWTYINVSVEKTGKNYVNRQRIQFCVVKLCKSGTFFKVIFKDKVIRVS